MILSASAEVFAPVPWIAIHRAGLSKAHAESIWLRDFYAGLRPIMVKEGGQSSNVCEFGRCFKL